MGVGLVDLLDRYQYYPVYEVLCSCLDVVSIIRLSKVCKALRPLQQQLWNVDRLLKRFVDEPVALRQEMRRHGAVISGGLALQFFARETWEESDLDLFVRRCPEANALGDYFVEREGYVLQPGRKLSRMYLASFGRVCRYARDNESLILTVS